MVILDLGRRWFLSLSLLFLIVQIQINYSLALGAKDLAYDAEEVNEVPCFEYKQADNYDKEWFEAKDAKGWRYIMGSKSHLAVLLNILTGKTPKETKTLEKSCFRTSTSNKGVSYTGFGNIADYSCKHVKGQKTRECHPTKKSTNIEWASRRSKTEAVIVLTDNKNYAVAFRCSRYNMTVWSLRALKTVVSPTHTQKALTFIEENGFDPQNYVTLYNEDCLDEEDLNPGSQVESVLSLGEGLNGLRGNKGKKPKKSKSGKDSEEDEKSSAEEVLGAFLG